MRTTLLNCPAPAKLNLFLHVTGRRPDGYHLLQSVFQLVDRCDLLHFTLREDGQVRRTTDFPGVPEQSDLVVRAALALQATALDKKGQRAPGVDIALDKKLPMGGGLGGGSSDAATTLMALNQLWQCGFSRAELMQIGLALGADVPFFLFGQNAFAEGIGEELAPVTTPHCWYVVLEPGVSVPTPDIFRSTQLTRDTKPVKITDFSAAPDNFGKNDLQGVAAQMFPAIAEALAWLSEFGNARMTGSGACVFIAVAQKQQADAVLKLVPAQWQSWKAEALARHPMEAVLKNAQMSI